MYSGCTVRYSTKSSFRLQTDLEQFNFEHALPIGIKTGSYLSFGNWFGLL